MHGLERFAFVLLLLLLGCSNHAVARIYGDFFQQQDHIKTSKDLLPGFLETLPHPRFNYSSLLLPSYHLTPQMGTWMNDPNAMFQYNGSVHVFYQLNPSAPVWGSPWWGHVVSPDLAHWKRLPPALKPDKWYDYDGVFSGSATILPDSTPLVMYTGVLNYSQYGFFYQLQAAAQPSDLEDPDLQTWVKLPDNPLDMGIPPGGTHAQFRDPISLWTVDALAFQQAQCLMKAPCDIANSSSGSSNSSTGSGSNRLLWLTAVGTLDDCIGSASLYVSSDLRTWNYSGSFFSQLAQNFSRYHVCLQQQKPDVPPGTKGFGGQCDQFGVDCRMWECPDYFDVAPGISVFKYSDQMRGRNPFAADWYVLGTLNYSFTAPPYEDGTDVFNAVVNGVPYTAKLLDYGTVYASKTFKMADGRLMWLGWVYEDSLGCSEVCASATDFILQHQQWQGLQTLPRQVTYNAETATLMLFPPKEIELLRQEQLFTGSLELTNGSGSSSGGGSSSSSNSNSNSNSDGGAPSSWCLPTMAFTRSEDAIKISNDGTTSDVGELLDKASLPQACQQVAMAMVLPEQPSEIPQRRQLEVQANYTLVVNQSAAVADEAPGVLEIGLHLLTGNGTFTKVMLKGTSSWDATSGSVTMAGLDVYVDRSASGGMTNTTMQGGPVDVPVEGLHSGVLQLTMFVDSSVLEVFVQQGLARLTSRIYPLTDQVAWGLSVFGGWEHGEVVADVAVYQLDSCWLD